MAPRVPEPAEPASLQLLGWWDLQLATQRDCLGRREQRLVALVALTGRRTRLQIAGTLWPDSSEHHAMSNLRTAVWHTRQRAPGLLTAREATLELAPHVAVDVARLGDYAARVAAAPEAVDLADAVTALEAGDLLPGWYDDWVLFERERLQHLRFRGLEALARTALQDRRPQDAALAARAALRVEPLHEGANLLLVRACLAAGSTVEAVRHFHDYRRRLERELGIRPSGALVELVRPLMLGAAREPVPVAQRLRR